MGVGDKPLDLREEKVSSQACRCLNLGISDRKAVQQRSNPTLEGLGLPTPHPYILSLPTQGTHIGVFNFFTLSHDRWSTLESPNLGPSGALASYLMGHFMSLNTVCFGTSPNILLWVGEVHSLKESVNQVM